MREQKKRLVKCGIIGLIGFLLSPLSWWNDLFINVPLAIGFGWLTSLVFPQAFEYMVVLGYWMTNLLGFVLMHYSARTAVTNSSTNDYKRELLFDILISLLYTFLILVLAKLHVIEPLQYYFD